MRWKPVETFNSGCGNANIAISSSRYVAGSHGESLFDSGVEEVIGEDK